MTLFLASVRNRLEADIALAANADIIDLKEPDAGALGAVDRATIADVVRCVGAPVSATVGDLPMHPDSLAQAITATAACGVDFVKFGVFRHAHAQACLEALHPLAGDISLIAVVFADGLPSFDAVAVAADMGAYGVMLDTAGKDGRALLDHLSLEAIANFIVRAKARGLSAGLAGSLKAQHVRALLELGPDLLGFRGALCQGTARGASLDPAACREIRAAIPKTQSLPQARRAGSGPALPAGALC